MSSSIKKNNKQKFLQKVQESLLYSFDINELQQNIVNAIGNYFDCDRCYFRIYDNLKKENVNTEIEYRSSEKIKSITEFNTDQEVHKHFIKAIEKSKKNFFIIENTEDYIAKNNLQNTKLENFIKELQIKSDILIPVKDRLGNIFILVLHYAHKQINLAEDDINTLIQVAEHSANTMNYIQLYEQAKENANRETALREIISLISKTLDFNEIKKTLVSQLGRILGSDINILYSIDPGTKLFFPVDKNSIYLSSKNIKSSLGVSIEDYEWGEHFRNGGKEVIYSDVEKFKKDFNLYGTKGEKFIDDYNIKSCIVIPVSYLNKLIGVLSINYTRDYKQINQDDINFVMLVAKQAGVLINNARLYERLKKNNLREKFLSEIIYIVKSSFDLQEITKLISNKIIEFYKVEKLTFCDNLIEKCKYFYNIEFDPAFKKENQYLLIEKLCKPERYRLNILVKDLSKKYQKETGFKQSIIIPVKLEQKKIGNICIFSKEKKFWEIEDIKLLEKIADNIAIAIRDSALYSKSRYMADVSHELKTPVAIIDAYINNLLNKGEYSPENVEKYLNIIKKNTVRLEKIIENLSLLSKLDEIKKELPDFFEKINLENIIKNVINIQKIIFNDKNIDFELITDSKIKITGNEVLIEQAIFNLVKNAVQYSHEDSKIIIKTQKTDNKNYISIKDSGIGISDNHLKNIFQRFYRIDKSRSRETGGTGLGLSIVEKIAEVHGGKVEVKSKLNEGSEFTIVIPDLK